MSEKSLADFTREQAQGVPAALTPPRISAAGRAIHLTRSETCIFQRLIMSRDRVVTKQVIYDHLYRDIGYPDRPDPKIIKVFVCKLRRKLARLPGGDLCIETDRGLGGYALRDLNGVTFTPRDASGKFSPEGK